MVEVSQTGDSNIPDSLEGQESGAVPEPVEDRATAHERSRIGVLGEHQQRQAGPRGVPRDRDVAEPDAVDVEHRVGRPGRQRSDRDAEIAGTRHAAILPEQMRVGY